MANTVVVTINLIAFVIITLIAFQLNLKARTNSIKGSETFTAMFLAMALWVLFFVLECLNSGVETKLLYIKCQYAAIVATPISYYYMCKNNYLKQRVTRGDAILLFSASAFILFSVWVNPFHLYYKWVGVKEIDGIIIFACERGILFYVCVVMIFVMFSYSTLSIFASLFKKNAPKGQIMLMLSAVVFPMAADIIFNLGITPIDWTPPSLVFSSIFVYVCFTYYGIFDSKTYVKRNVLDLTADGVISVTSENKVDYMNATMEKMLKCSPENYRGKFLSELFPGIDENLEGEAETTLQLDLGSGNILHLSFRVLVNDESTKFAGGKILLVRNITDVNRVATRLSYITEHDETTGLYNSKKLIESMKEYEDKNENGLTGTFLMNVGALNYGTITCILTTEQRKELDKEIAKYINRNILPGTVLARISENEYSVFSNGIIYNLEKVKEILEKAEKAHIKIGNQRLAIDFRAGFYIIESDVSIDEALANASYALSNVFNKRSIKSEFIYSKAMKLQHQLYRHILTTNEAINYERDFCVEFQPIFDVTQNKIIGAESFVRWNHPTIGRVFPSTFIPVFEATGNIKKLGMFVIEKALSAGKEYIKKYGTDFFVSVNLSNHQIFDRDFICEVKKKMLEVDYPPEKFTFEVKERAAFIYLEEMLAFAKEVTELGANIAIDGYKWDSASIVPVGKFKCKMIKLDVALIQSMKSDDDSVMIVKSFLELCKKLGISLIVKCVEQMKDIQLAEKLGISLIEGNSLSGSLSKNELLELAKSSSNK